MSKQTLEIKITPVVVENPVAFNRMLERLEQESILAIDTETVGNESLELYEEIKVQQRKLYEAALAHCLKFPITTPGISRNNVKGAKGSLERLLKIRKDILKMQDKASSSLSGLRFWDCHIGCFQIGCSDGTMYAIRPQNFSRDEWLRLGKVLNSRKVLLLQNAQFDIKIIYTHCGFLLDGRKIFDTKLAEWLLTNGLNQRTGLKSLAKKYLEYEMSKDKLVRVSNWLGPWSDKQLRYALLDVAILFPLYEKQKQELFSLSLKRAHRMRCDFTTVAAILDMSGMPIDIPGMEGLKERLEKKQKFLDADMRLIGKVVDEDFNPNSSAQVYDMLVTNGIIVNDTNEKTLKDSDYSGHPLVECILDYREVAKLLSYVDKYLTWSRDSRMYSLFNIDGTHTGRLSSGSDKYGTKDPFYTNAQNPPKGEFRTYIRAPKGRKFINADYSQIEIRWVARLSRDPVMLTAYQNGDDLHRLTAIIISGLTEEQFDALPEEKRKEMRQKAKAVNFGLLFGAGANTLVKYAKMNYNVTLTLEEAEKIKRAWKQKYEKVGKWGVGWQAWQSRDVKEKLYVRTASGLIRFFTPENSGKKSAWKFTDSLNTPVQGSAADGLINAMNILVYNLLDDGYEPFVDFWIPTVVHDEVLLECLEKWASVFFDRVKEAMIKGMQELIISVPVEVEPKIVDNWQEAK